MTTAPSPGTGPDPLAGQPTVARSDADGRRGGHHPASQRRAGEMTLTEHLRELRTRLVRALAAVAVGTIVGWFLFPQILDILTAPYCTAIGRLAPGESCNLVALTPLEPFSVRFRTSLMGGLFLAGPVVFTQLWRFITPGLTRRERRLTLPFVILSQLMFALGIATAYLIIPQGLTVLLGIGGPNIDTFIAADAYLTFFLAMSLAFGIVFELPLILVALALAGVVTSSGLRRARPYAIVGMFAAAAFITPTVDAGTQALVAGPMVVFYELSILIARLLERRRRRQGTTS
jgi:sec-independent protein translocase protein TatC